jgi:hypothetical protein
LLHFLAALAFALALALFGRLGLLRFAHCEKADQP